MKNKILYIVLAILVLVVIGGGLFFFSGDKGTQNETGVGQQTTTKPSTEASAPAADTTMVDCSKATDPLCFMGRANGCLPVTAKMTGSGDDTTVIELTVLGVENEKCHFQRKINGVTNLNCFFPKGTNIANAIDQTFGNDHGLQKVVDEACGSW